MVWNKTNSQYFTWLVSWASRLPLFYTKILNLSQWSVPLFKQSMLIPTVYGIFETQRKGGKQLSAHWLKIRSRFASREGKLLFFALFCECIRLILLRNPKKTRPRDQLALSHSSKLLEIPHLQCYTARYLSQLWHGMIRAVHMSATISVSGHWSL